MNTPFYENSESCEIRVNILKISLNKQIKKLTIVTTYPKAVNCYNL